MPKSSQATRAQKALNRKTSPRRPDYASDYLITPSAAIWQGEDAEFFEKEARQRRPVRSARLPISVPRGRCLALKGPLPGREDWDVLVERAGMKTWLPVPSVMNKKALLDWVRTGF